MLPSQVQEEGVVDLFVPFFLVPVMVEGRGKRVPVRANEVGEKASEGRPVYGDRFFQSEPEKLLA